MNKIIYSNNEIENKQTLMLKDRNFLEISGVNKIESLNEYEFVISTILGNMIIRGSNLEMIQLDIEKGILQIKGTFTLFEYTDKINKKDKSLIGKIFK